MLFITDCGIKRGAGAGGGGHEAESSSNLLGKPRGRGGPCELYFVIVFSREDPLQCLEGSCTSIGTQVHQVWHHVFTDIQIDNPIHQVEANERNREEDSGIFVDVGRRNASHLLQVLLAVQHGRNLVEHELIGVVSSATSPLSLLLSSPRKKSRS